MQENTAIKKDERNYGIDILRMLAMILIIILHISSYSVRAIDGLAIVPPEKMMYLLLQTVCGAGVGIYAILSGYVAYGKKARFSNLVYLWLRVLFYSVLIPVIFYITKEREYDTDDFIKRFFPTIFNYWWYWSAYVVLCLFAPLINKGLETINRKASIFLFVSLFVVFSVLTSIFGRTGNFNMEGGLSAVWLIVLYIIGALIKKNNFFSKVKTWQMLLIYSASLAFIFGSEIVLQRHHMKILGNEMGGSLFHQNLSPFTVICSISLLIVFARIKVNGKLTKNVIGFVGPSVFSAYLIHAHHYVVSFTKERLIFIGEYNQFVGVLLTIAICVGVFVACILIDIPREILFKKIKIKEKFKQLENKIFSENC